LKQNQEKQDKKVFIFSLDGVSFNLLNQLREDNAIPFLSKLIDSSSYGDLLSTDPPLTPTAWASIFTGLNPGNHGIYDFIVQNGEGVFKPTNSTFIQGKALWDYVSNANKKVVLLNQPITYPPYPVNGIMISDHIFTPKNAKSISNPEDFQNEVSKLFGPYKIFNDVSFDDSKIEDELKEYKKEINYKTNIFEYIAKNYEWDLFVLYFSSTDQIQHSNMHIIDKGHPNFNKNLHGKYYHKILEYFKHLDAHIKKIYESLPLNTSVLFVSDHGLCPLTKYLHLNTWLLDRGYLCLKNTLLIKLKYYFFKFGLTPENLHKIFGRFFSIKRAMPMMNNKLNSFLNKIFLSFGDIDWNKTTLFSKGNYGQIFINKKRRTEFSTDQILKNLINDLMEWIDYECNEKIVERVLCKEDIYHGGKVNLAQDVLFYTKDFKYKALGTLDFNSNKTISNAFGGTGFHSPYGIFICSGEGIKANNKLQNLKAEDITPTILQMFGLSVPENCDGRIIDELFINPDDAHTKIENITNGDFSIKKNEDKFEYSNEDQLKIEKRLRDLGYL